MNPFPAPFPVLESLESRLAPAGIVALTLSNGVLTITGDTLSNELQVTQTGGLWTVSATADDVAHTGSATLFTLNGGAASASAAFAAPTSVKANLAAGNDVMALTGLSLTGALTVDMGTGDDDLDLTSVDLGGKMTVKMGTGADYFTAGGDLVFGKGFSVDLGTGANTFDLNADTLESNGSITAFGGGTAAEEQAFVFAAALGEVNGSVTLRTSSAASPTTFEIGDVAGDNLEINGAFTLQSGAGADTVTLRETLYVHTAFSLKLGNGDNTVTTTDLADLDVGSLVYTGGTGADQVTFNGDNVSVYGGVSFSAGAGSNMLDLNPATTLTIGGSLSYTGGTGIDTLYIDGPDALIGGAVRFSGSSGANYLGFNAIVASAGSLSYSGGSGSDIVDLGEVDGLTDLVTIKGNVGISASTGEADIQIRNADIYGSLTVSTNVFAGGVDTLQILETDVRGSATLNLTGAAEGYVGIRDSIFDRAVSISTGNGDDTVLFDVDEDVSSILSYFYGAVRINLGAGNDLFGAGATPVVDATVGNNFYSSVVVNGGAGYDQAYFMDSVAYNNGFEFIPLTSSVEDYA